MSQPQRGIREETDAEAAAFVADPQWLHVTSHVGRPNLLECVHEIEHAHYRPGTPRNDLFHLRTLPWQGLVWVLVSVPIGDKALVEAVAAKHQLRLADGVPTMFSADGIARFPHDNPRVFTFNQATAKKETP